jgi:tetratricopeptide (TPR) repeat protein
MDPQVMNPQDWMLEGQKKFQAKEYMASAENFHRAAVAYHTAGDEPTAAEMANNRSVALLLAGDAEGAYQAAYATDRVFAEIQDIRRQGMALGNQAAALEELGKTDDAMDLYTHADELLKQAGEKQMRSIVLQHISSLQMRKGKQIQAIASMDAALDNRDHLNWVDRAYKSLLSRVTKLLKG